LEKTKLETMKNVLVRSTTIFASIILFALSHAKNTNAAPTKWEDVTSSMSELLDSGWKVISHGSNRAMLSGGLAANDFDEEMLSFLLIKDEKYILCRMINPKPPVATRASCRKIN
jgi:hypothetical protein